jgi:RHS repeat-associated protein
VVVEYTYDAWGKPLSVTGLLAASVGVKNPYRYRGYRYDEETGLYYLQSRYYNPRVGRFLNADGVILGGGSLLEMNLFAYCAGNPVLLIDPTGRASSSSLSQMQAELQKVTANIIFGVGNLQENLNKFNSLNAAIEKKVYDNKSNSISKSFGTLKIDTDGSGPIHPEDKHQQSTTALTLGNDGYLNADVNHYVVRPNPKLNNSIVEKGDLAVVIDHKTNRYVLAIVGDVGDEDSWHEVSISVAWDLGYRNITGNRSLVGYDNQFEIIYFPSTAEKWYSVESLALQISALTPLFDPFK